MVASSVASIVGSNAVTPSKLIVSHAKFFVSENNLAGFPALEINPALRVRSINPISVDSFDEIENVCMFECDANIPRLIPQSNFIFCDSFHLHAC